MMSLTELIKFFQTEG